MKCRSEFKHGFTNRVCLHCAILKALHGFKEEICNFSFKMFKMSFSIFWKYLILKINIQNFIIFLKTMWNSLEQPVQLTQK